MESTQSPKKDEISIKEVVLLGRDWFRYFLRKWPVIVICGLVGGGLGFTFAFFKKTSYVSRLTFVLEDNKSNSLGAYAGLASQFGIDLSGASSSGIFSGDNIMEFLKSRLMVQKVLLSGMNDSNGKQVSLADHYIDVQEYRKGWAKVPELANFTIPAGMSMTKLTLQQDSILGVVYKQIMQTELEISKPDKKLGFFEVRYISESERFSKVFTERLVEEATTFYVNAKTKRLQAIIDKLQMKADSIEQLLDKSTYNMARQQDLNRNPARSLALVGMEIQGRDKMILQTAYGEVLKSLETTRMVMVQESPLIQIVDTPILPLEKKKLGKLKGLVAGGLIGGILCLLYLFFRRSYKKMMTEN
ncbi:hypothetical protein [Chitinophaga caseinilytica]|uniref:Lipopolysaccharide biosynthesis protein n=1 Tax=Chitinophaga caseinilytica TaxID=2267521 RepID=A0ABZ2ZB20_9BACT